MSTEKTAITLHSPLFTTRWGREEAYRISISNDSIRISNNNHLKFAVCQVDEDGGCVWSGYREKNGNPLMKLLQDEGIEAPASLPHMLEKALLDWHERLVSEDQLREAISDLFAWVNDTSRSKPVSDIWE